MKTPEGAFETYKLANVSFGLWEKKEVHLKNQDQDQDQDRATERKPCKLSQCKITAADDGQGGRGTRKKGGEEMEWCGEDPGPIGPSGGRGLGSGPRPSTQGRTQGGGSVVGGGWGHLGSPWGSLREDGQAFSTGGGPGALGHGVCNDGKYGGVWGRGPRWERRERVKDLR